MPDNLIVDPNQVELYIVMSPTTGKTGYKINKDVPFPTIVAMLAQVLGMVAENVARSMVQSAASKTVLPPGGGA